MPTVEASRKDLEKLAGIKFPKGKLEEALMFVKGELDAVDGDTLKIDIKDTNRPDLWSVEGIARELRSQYGKERGIPKYNIPSSGITAVVDPALAGIRGKAAYAVARNAKITGEAIKQMIQLQEKICQTYGRKREEVAIGIFDLDKVSGDVKYYAASPKEKFVPLGYKVEMDLREILEEHPKGKEFGALLKKHKKYPLLVDSEKEVLSMPPVVNSEGSGKVTTKTKNLFIDITGHKQETIDVAMRVVCAALHDRGAKVESVKVKYGGETMETPSFGIGKIGVSAEFIRDITGLNLSNSGIGELLGKKRMEITGKGDLLVVSYPDYRPDILHPVDVAEDVLIAHGYNDIEPEEVNIATTGGEGQRAKMLDGVRESCVGAGLQEVLTFTLTSKENQEGNMCLPEQEFVEIANPVSANWVIFRKSILPELLSFLSKNKHHPIPQKVFEVGKVVHLDKKSETGVREQVVLSVLIASKETNFTEAKSLLDAITSNMGLGYKISKARHPSFEGGKAGAIELPLGKKGVVGELGKEVCGKFGLDITVSGFEIEL